MKKKGTFSAAAEEKVIETDKGLSLRDTIYMTFYSHQKNDTDTNMKTSKTHEKDQ